MLLKNRTALITGASRGIGREIALAYAREGADLAVTARSAEDLDSLKNEIEQAGRKCAVILADLSEKHSAKKISDEFFGHFRHLDILVNNAGVGSSIDPRPTLEFDDRIWDLTLMINLTLPYLLCKALIPQMVERKFGRVINIASLAGKVGLLHGSAYAASKHGLLGLTRTLAIELAPTGVTVNAICPGPVRTATNEKRIQYDARRLGKSVEQYEAGMTPMGRRLEPAELAPLAVFLATEQASVITGQAWNVDCGALMTG